MTIKILTFGIARDIIGKSEFDFIAKDTITAGILLNTLVEKYPELGNLASVMLAVNMQYADDQQTIQNGDVVAIIPPTSGG